MSPAALRWSLSVFSLIAAGSCSLVAPKALGQAGPGFLVLPSNASSITILNGEEAYFNLSYVAWGPSWSWTGVEGSARADGSASVMEGKIGFNTGATASLKTKVEQAGPNTIRLSVDLTSDKSTTLTQIVLALETSFAGTVQAGSGGHLKLPVGITDFGSSVSSLTYTDAAGGKTQVSLSPPMAVGADGAVRLIFAAGKLEAGVAKRQTVTFSFPGSTGLASDPRQAGTEPGFEKWFPFVAPTNGSVPNGSGPDERDMSAWLDGPAGKKGRILASRDDLVYDGKPVKLWGLNICYSDCSPPKELADRRADFYARNGINAVRLHKYADGPGWAGIQSAGSFEKFDAAALDRMDYFVAALKKKGIYVKLSPTFGVGLGPEDKATVPYMDEFGATPAPGDRLKTQHGAVFLGSEIQDLQIRQTLALLKHKNPYTGLTYAQDPAVAFVELFNEDSVLFYGTMDRLQKIPTLRKRASVAFTTWLKAKYKTESALLQAWGDGALNSFTGEGFTGESWSQNSIVPAGNPWFYDPDQMAGSQKFRAVRLHDTMAFLHDLQNSFYARFVTQIRSAGYSGEIISSNWIAGRGFSHFYNLNSDQLVGTVDRHNYFGGGDGALINDGSMLAKPGSGMLSSGMNQVQGRPFSLSEWIHVWPNEWGGEGPAILGAYGMGLQGWDVSFIFQNRDDGAYSSMVGRDQWDATAPQVMALFPAISRQVLRGDVAPSQLKIPRNVHLPSMLQGRLGFDDSGSAEGDIKTSDSATVPAEAMAVGKMEVRFTKAFEPTPKFDTKPFSKGGILTSSTNQLAWLAGEAKKSGWFTVNTPATQALVGFASGKTAELNDAAITSRTKFASIYLTARDKESTLANGKAVLITALARARNTGMKIVGPLLTQRGQTPILMEPVVAEITLKRQGGTIHVLNLAGQKTGVLLPVNNGKVVIDTAKDKTCWYLVTYP